MSNTKKLGILGAVAISLALISPSMSVSLNPQAIAEQVGSGITLVYIIALIPLLLIAYSFMVLTHHYGGSGSLFGLVGRFIGPRSGSIAGLWLVIAYMSAIGTTGSAFGIFMVTGLNELFAVSLPNWIALAFMAVGLIIGHLLALRELGKLSHVLLIFEGVTMLLILFVCGVTLFTLLTTGGPQGQRPSSDVFDVSTSTTGSLGIALTFAVLSSVGFEAAAAVAKDTTKPKYVVPRALLLTAITSSLFFIVVSTIAVWGFGPSTDEMNAFIASGSVPSQLAEMYVGEGFGVIISFGGALSAFACVIAAQVAGARILHTFGTCGALPAPLAKISNGGGIPTVATLTMLIGGVVLMLLAGVGASWDAFNLFVLVSDFTGVVILAAYAMAAIAAGWLFIRLGGRHALLAVFPALAVVCVAVIFVLSVHPLPDGWEAYAPIAGIIAIVLLFIVGLAIGGRVEFTEDDDESALVEVSA